MIFSKILFIKIKIYKKLSENDELRIISLYESGKNSKAYIYNRINQPSTYDLKVFRSKDILNIYENLYKNAHFFLIRKKLKYGSLLEKFNRQPLVNSGKEKCNSNPEPSLI